MWCYGVGYVYLGRILKHAFILKLSGYLCIFFFMRDEDISNIHILLKAFEQIYQKFKLSNCAYYFPKIKILSPVTVYTPYRVAFNTADFWLLHKAI